MIMHIVDLIIGCSEDVTPRLTAAAAAWGRGERYPVEEAWAVSGLAVLRRNAITTGLEPIETVAGALENVLESTLTDRGDLLIRGAELILRLAYAGVDAVVESDEAGGFVGDVLAALAIRR